MRERVAHHTTESFHERAGEHFNSAEHLNIPINDDWEFKQANDSSATFRRVTQFPTNIHLDLLSHALIPDPFVGKNENKVQWVGEVPWIYRTTFKTPKLHRSHGAKAVLVFDGLDTFATVYLNGQEILRSDNMFIPLRVNVTSHLRAGGGNVLEILFESAYHKGCELLRKYPDHHWGCSNGDTSRLAVRKAQYHWGWDLGPKLMTCGPWKPVRLEVYSSRITDLYFRTVLDESLKSASILVVADVEGDAEQVELQIISPDGMTVASKMVDALDGHALHRFFIQDPILWYPKRYGKQALYTLSAILNGEKSSKMSKRFGVRQVNLVQQPLIAQPGTSFFFKVNHVPIFCGGSNWIPADSLLPRVSKQCYHDWVKLAVDGNQNMLRVWAGGVFEDQSFYDACDELGILVWQDFLFACGNYPTYPAFLQSVKREAEENVKLLRHHPCIVIYAGNNEDYEFQQSSGLTYDREDTNPRNWLRSDFPARYIYEKLLLDVCSELVPDTPFHFGSPWGGKTTHDPTVGDIHQWDVWHGMQRQYQDFDMLGGRFVSEFGMEGFPNTATIDCILPKGIEDPERYATSSTIDFHNKAGGHTKTLAHYVSENIRFTTTPFRNFVYATQLVQAEALASAYRLWKRQWKGPRRRYCGGALVWQLNDCWPAISWSIADYYQRPKPAYFAAKRELADLTVAMKRVEHLHEDSSSNDHTCKQTKIEVWGCNLKIQDIRVDVVLKVFDVTTGAEIYSQTIAADFLLPQNCSTEIAGLDVPVRRKGRGEEGQLVVAAYIFQDGVHIARAVNWPDPLRYVHVQRPKELSAKVRQCGTMVDISAEIPVKGVLLECDDKGVIFDDNMVDLVPGEIIGIGVKGMQGRAIVGIEMNFYGADFL